MFLLAEQLSQNRLLHVQTIFRLIDDDGLWAVKDICRNLFSAMSRQAMHNNGVGFRPLQQSLVQLVGGERP